MAGHTFPELISIDGMRRDHTEAATITPDANPSRAFWTGAGISFLMKNTNADPRAVPRNGIISAVTMAWIFILYKDTLFSGSVKGGFENERI